ncbi:hypothetical protein HYFRA_00013760 [Hymenoscyphus fraxineus]|uniref:RTA1 domain protein n=1 Tax=Hymenoscyphus fraxineus TaxID=746836 RepID=A0A9N9L904_9HELO|nr:hypothetical protein HYFRA_00013760 [Hymenoscyphus fraxineus]
MEDGKYVEGSLWYYAPNKVAPVIFAFLFSISMFWHFYQCIRYKCWKVTGIFPWAALLFVVGYILREIGAFNYDNVPIFISSLVFIYAAPPIYELANYFIFSRLLYYIPHHTPIHPGRVLSTFGFISTIIETLNANGAALVANTTLPQQKQDTGKALLKSALILQLVVLSCFILLAATFHRRCRAAGLAPRNLVIPLRILYISSALIGIRTLFRTVEYFSISSLSLGVSAESLGLPSPLVRYEWFFWVFEGSLMLINTFLLNAWHPMRYLPRNHRVYLESDGVTEVEGPGYRDRRKWYVTFLDPFDVGGMLRGRRGGKSSGRFWVGNVEARGEEGEGKGGGDGDAGRV